VTEVTVRATFPSPGVLEDGHFGRLAHLFDALTGLIPSAGPWMSVQISRANDIAPRASRNVPDFVAPKWDPFSIRDSTSE